MYSNAASWGSTFWQIGAVIGPGFAGFLYAQFGLVVTLYFVVILLIINFLIISTISKKEVKYALKIRSKIYGKVSGKDLTLCTIIKFFFIPFRWIWWLFFLAVVVGHTSSFCRRYFKGGPPGPGYFKGRTFSGRNSYYFCPPHLFPLPKKLGAI